MKQKITLKQLYPTTIFISIATGFFTLGILLVAHFNFLKTVPSIILLADVVVSLVIAVIVFMICLVNIWVTNYGNKKYENKKKAIRTSVLLSYLFSTIPLLIGALLMTLFRILAASKLAEYNATTTNPVIQNHHISTLFIVVLFLIILFWFNTPIRFLVNFVVMRDEKIKLELENAQLKIKNIEAACQQLKQQIHPHFLFNSLNTLKVLIKDNPDAEIFLKRLSDFLRASITFNNENVIELREELKFCMDYLELQKVRFGEALQFTVNIPEEIKSGFVPVFSLQQLIENAIKHNALTINSPLIINVEQNSNRVIVSNNIKAKNMPEESTGMGLINLAERYKILSGDEVIIQADSNHFSVSLKILSHETSREHKTIE